jgi:hypothetical protein
VRLAPGFFWGSVEERWPIWAGGSRTSAATQQQMSRAALARSRYSKTGSSRQARDAGRTSAPPRTQGVRTTRNSPGRFVRAGWAETPHDEHAKPETKEQDRARDENVFHDDSLPPDAVRGHPVAESQPEERGPDVKHKSHARCSRPARRGGHPEIHAYTPQAKRDGRLTRV